MGIQCKLYCNIRARSKAGILPRGKGGAVLTTHISPPVGYCMVHMVYESNISLPTIGPGEDAVTFQVNHPWRYFALSQLLLAEG